MIRAGKVQMKLMGTGGRVKRAEPPKLITSLALMSDTNKPVPETSVGWLQKKNSDS